MKTEKQNRVLSLRQRVLWILIFFILAVMLALGVNVVQNVVVTERMNREIDDYYSINAFARQFIQAEKSLELYWRSPAAGGDNLRAFQQSVQEAQSLLNQMEQDYSVIGVRQYLWTNALQTMFTSYVEETSAVLQGLQNGQRDEAVRHYYTGAVLAGGYVHQYAQRLLQCKLADGQEFYRHSQEHARRLWILQISVMLLTALAGLLLFRTLRKVLDPMQELADASRAIMAQDFSQPDLVVEQDDEVGRMVDAFNQMKHSMQQSVETLQEKNEMEARLHKKEMEALEASRLLGEAKMAQLRSQINPHFLFNTLNVINRMAQTEQAPRTKTLVMSLAHLLRYTLESDADQVTLARETHVIDEYFTLYKTRFGDRVGLKWEIDPDLELYEVMVPSFILQPLVENAFRHGISPKIDGGAVRIKVERREQWLYISVADNGVGMDAEQLEKVRCQIRSCQPKKGHVGLYNVVARLKLTDPNCEMWADSRPGEGSEILMRLPYREMSAQEEEQDAEDTDC